MRSSIVNYEATSLKVDPNWRVLLLSEIYYLPGVGAHCLATLSTGSSLLLQYNEVRRKLTSMRT
jgi:hypothetical protein